MYKRENQVLLIDVTFLFDQYSKRGIGRYGKEVLKRIVRIIFEEKGWKLHLIGFHDLEQNLIEAGLSKFAIEEYMHSIEFHSIGKPTLSSPSNIKEWVQKFSPIIKDVHPDIYLAIHFERGLPTTPGINWGMPNDIVNAVVAHDAIPIVNDSFSQRGPVLNWIKKQFFMFMWSGIKHADIVFAPSNKSKADLVEYGDIPEHLIKRVYLGIDEMFYRESVQLNKEQVDEILDTYQVTNKSYFFYDSGIEENKGIYDLLEIFGKVSQEDDLPDYLVITGGNFKKGIGDEITPRSSAAVDILERAGELGIKDKLIATDRIPDEDLVQLLHHADAYMYLSHYEGFGFGPLQAMAADIPAIVANTSCLPEITDGGAFLIDLENKEKAIQEAIAFLKDSKAIERYKKKGKSVVSKYNWDKTVETLWENLKKLAHN
jgi:glycosyltransferase involved in cell wall biosynthesis